MNKINNPHDKFLKETLTIKANAIDFIKYYLPQEIVPLINLSKIEIEKDSFVTEELQEYFTDLLYKVEIAKQESYIYILFEHKSYPEKLIGLQLLEYLIKCWKMKIKQKEKLPIILPLVIYHGKKSWNIGTKFSDIIDNKEEVLQKYLPNFEYILYDLSKYKDTELLGTENLKVMFQLLKYIYSDDLLYKLEGIMKLFSQGYKENLDYLKTITIYILNSTEIELNDLVKIVKESVSNKGGEFVMTTAQLLRQEGIQQGIKQDKIEVAKNLLDVLDEETIAEKVGLPLEEVIKLKN